MCVCSGMMLIDVCHFHLHSCFISIFDWIRILIFCQKNVVTETKKSITLYTRGNEEPTIKVWYFLVILLYFIFSWQDVGKHFVNKCSNTLEIGDVVCIVNYSKIWWFIRFAPLRINTYHTYLHIFATWHSARTIERKKKIHHNNWSK